MRGAAGADDHLSLVAGMRRDQVERLNAAGSPRSRSSPASTRPRPTGIMPQTLERLRPSGAAAGRRRGRRASLRAAAAGAKRGFRLLPAPSPGDIFFDIEGYPYFERSAASSISGASRIASGDGWRVHVVPVRRPRGREARRSSSSSTSSTRGSRRSPTCTSITTPPYETSALKRLMGEHATREEEVDDLLRREVFVDLYQVVRQSMRISYDSYSMKKVREFFMEAPAQGAVTTAATRSSSSSGAARPATRRFSRRSATTTRRTATPRGCCATGCSSGRAEAERHVRRHHSVDVEAEAADEGARGPRRQSRAARRLTLRRGAASTAVDAPRPRRCCAISSTTTAARPSRSGGPTSSA